MKTKFSKIKKILAAVAIAAVLLGLTVFGFHFSCRLKAQGDSRNTYSNNRIVVADTCFRG